uniref:Origin recognition complex subunit 1 n=1 Tax=Haemonchus contortus TaxID=6289 RepID=A0A7I4YZR0_HAECO
MDSDSDEDRLVIVEEEEDRGQLEIEATCEKAIKEENPVQEEIDVEVVSKQKESSSDGRNGRQKRSCLPASLKERIIRSSARTKALSAEDVELKKKQQPRLPKSVRFSKQDTKVVVKTEVDEEVNSSSEPPLLENDVCDLKPSVQRSAVFPHSEKPSQQRRRGAVSTNPICGRKRVFSHPRLSSGQRVAQLIEPAEPALCPKPRVRRKPKKIVPSDSDVAGTSKKPAAARGPRLASKKVIKQEPPEDQENVQEPSQPQKATADNDDVSFLEKLMSEVDWKEKPATKAKRGRPAKNVKGKGKENKRISKADPEQPQVTDVDEECISKRLRCRPHTVPIKLESPKMTPEKPDQESSSSSGDEFELKNNSDEEEFEERMSRASRRKLTRSLLRECNSLPARGSRRKTAQSTSVRKRVPRPCIEEHVEDDGIETFDTFLKYPNDIVCPETVEGFCSRPNDEMRKIYEDYMTNVRGEGVPEPDLERKLMEKLQRMEEELARLKEIKVKLEQEDDLGAEPFLDYVAYRLHPLNTRGEDRRLFGIHPQQLQNNSCALSDLNAAMWCVKPPKYIPLFRQKREFDDLSERLDALSGGGRQGVAQDEEVDPIYMSVIREKIANAGNVVHEIRGRQFSHFDKVIKEEESAYGFDYYVDGDNVAPQDHDEEPSLFSVVKKEEGEIPDDVDPYEEGLGLGAIDQDGNLFSWLSQ